MVDIIGHTWMQGEFPLEDQVIEDFTQREEMLKETEDVDDVEEELDQQLRLEADTLILITYAENLVLPM